MSPKEAAIWSHFLATLVERATRGNAEIKAALVTLWRIPWENAKDAPGDDAGLPWWHWQGIETRLANRWEGNWGSWWEEGVSDLREACGARSPETLTLGQVFRAVDDYDNRRCDCCESGSFAKALSPVAQWTSLSFCECGHEREKHKRTF